MLHVSFNDPEHPFPVVLPMLGCTGNYSDASADPNDTEQDLYIHGYVSGRIFRSGKNAEGQGLPITVAASYVSKHLRNSSSSLDVARSKCIMGPNP